MAAWSPTGRETRYWRSFRASLSRPQPRIRLSRVFHKLQPWFKSPMPPSDFAFANDIRAAAALRTPRTSRMLLVAYLALLLTFLTWTHFPILDDVKPGNGKDVPPRQAQLSQTPDVGSV